MSRIDKKHSIIPSFFCSIVTIAVIVFSVPTSAQIIPPSVEPSKVQERLIDQKRVPKSQKEYELPKGIDTMIDKPMDDVFFVLNSIDLEGNLTISTGELRKTYIDHVGKMISLKDLHNIARRMTAIYRKKGYLLSRAIIPEQRIKDGVIKIQVIEGYVTEVIFEGKSDITHNTLVRNFAKNIKSSVPLNVFDLEQYLLILNDLPGVKAKSIFRPADKDVGAADLIVQLETDLYEAFTAVDNRGTKFLGPIQISGGVKLNSLMGRNEQITLRGIVTGDAEEMQYLNIAYAQPLPNLNTKIRTSLAKTMTEPGAGLSSLNIEGDSMEYALFVDHTWIRSRVRNLSSSIGLKYRDTETDILNEKFSEDKIRALHISTEYDFIDRTNAITYLGIEFVRGFDVLDASNEEDELSRVNGETEFTHFNINASRQQPIYKKLAMFVGVAGQYALDSLLASEEFDIGGASFGSAYDPSEIAGDHGASARLELQYGCLNNFYAVKTMQCYSFYDVGAVWNKDTIASEDGRQTLTSVGAGSRFNLKRNVSGAVELSLPLTREVAAENDKDARVFFGLRYDF